PDGGLVPVVDNASHLVPPSSAPLRDPTLIGLAAPLRFAALILLRRHPFGIRRSSVSLLRSAAQPQDRRTRSHPWAADARSRSSNFRTLPLAFSGSSSTTSTNLGTL